MRDKIKSLCKEAWHYVLTALSSLAATFDDLLDLAGQITGDPDLTSKIKELIPPEVKQAAWVGVAVGLLGIAIKINKIRKVAKAVGEKQ